MHVHSRTVRLKDATFSLIRHDEKMKMRLHNINPLFRYHLIVGLL